MKRLLPCGLLIGLVLLAFNARAPINELTIGSSTITSVTVAIPPSVYQGLLSNWPRNISFSHVIDSPYTTNITVYNVGIVGCSNVNGWAYPVGSNTNLFTLSNTNYDLGRGSNSAVTLVFSNSVPGNSNLSIVLTNIYGNSTSVLVSATATNANAPIIAQFPLSLVITTMVNVPFSTTFTVSNAGPIGSLLSGTASMGTYGQWFSLSPNSYTDLASGQSVTITNTFSYTNAAVFVDTINLTGGGGTNIAITAVTTNAPPPPAVDLTNAILYWPMSEGVGTTLTDSADSENGTHNASWVSGPVALDFNGANDYSLSDSTIDPASNILTLCFWMSLDSTQGFNKMIVENGTNYLNRNFAVFIDGFNRWITASHRDMAGDAYLDISYVAPVTGSYVHVACVFDKHLPTVDEWTNKVYFNSVQQAFVSENSQAGTGGTNNFVNTFNLYGGARNGIDSLDVPMDGKLRQLIIYTGEKSQTQISNIMVQTQ